jgi:hypothetical protein
MQSARDGGDRSQRMGHSAATILPNYVGKEAYEETIRETSTVDPPESPALPDGPMTVGIDGGLVRAAHKEGWFEVIAGKSVVVSAYTPPSKSAK